ncbi:hypothetical protein BA700_04310 [Corynebacterium stationis]|nr:hypothetical protein AW169_04310 [Corynebacterium stationis]AQX70675.1 hypothetical protein CA21670_03480 [Corynebacterium stationis]ASJ18364.1 hypothetical protein BA700_04310 [Corynebacterium stationis]
MDKLIQKNKKTNKKVASFSTDAAEYFHRIPASILSSKWFKEEHLKHYKSTDFKLHLTACLNEALVNWEKNTAEALRLKSGESSTPDLGLPVGLSCSAFLGNVVLDSFDKVIGKEIKPAYYGRYVDDITLVMEWHEELTDPQQVWQWIRKRTDRITTAKSDATHSPTGNSDVLFRVYPSELNPSNQDSDSDALYVTFKSNKTRLLVA